MRYTHIVSAVTDRTFIVIVIVFIIITAVPLRVIMPSLPTKKEHPMWIPSPSIYPSVYAPVLPIIDKTIHRIFQKYGRSLHTTVQQPRPYFPPAPSELPAVQQHSVAQCLRAPQTCTISATAIALMLNSDMMLKCYPQAAVTITVRQGRMKHGRSFLAIVAIRRSVVASRAATGCREAMRSMREIGCSPSPGSGGDNFSYIF